MSKSFVSLHSHTDNSKLDGAARIPDLVKRAEELGMPAIAVTDHGSMSGFYDLYTATKDSSVRPIYGIESYLSPDVPRTHKEPVRWNAGGEDDVSGNGAYTHMTMLAETTEGLYNLFKMSTEAFLTGFYRAPRMDLELLQQYGKGIIATTGCPSGEVQTWLRIGDYGKAREAAAKFRDIFGKDNFFVEVMDHGLGIEKRVIPDLLRLAKDLGLGTVATTDLHYVHRHEAHMHDALLCIGSGAKLNEPNRFKFDADDFYLKTAEEMRKIWDDVAPDACDNTLAIAERCVAQPRTGEIYMPDFPVPDGETTETWLAKETQAGLERRFPDGIPPEHQKQADYEVGVMNQMGFPGYFLVTADFINWAKTNGIRVGPGRGCLSGDSNVLTPYGFRNIKEIRPGDEVYNENGVAVTVPEVFVYDCDEELVEIKAFYGADGNKMTADHKVLVSKARRVSDKRRLAQGYRFEEGYAEPEWIRADEVEVGDLVVTPKLEMPVTHVGWTFQPTVTVGTNKPYEHSTRRIAAKLGVARSSVKAFFDTGGARQGPAQDRIRGYMTANALILEEEKARRFVTASSSGRVLRANFDAGFFFGLFISDGWLRSDGSGRIGFAQRRSSDAGTIPDLIQRLFGLPLSHNDHRRHDLRQYSLSHRGICDLVRRLFPDYKFNARSKYIPQALFETPEEFRRGLLHGLWYGDGSHAGNKSKYTTVSRQLAEDVVLLLGTLGLPAGLKSAHRVEARDGYGADRTEYSVTTAHNFDPSTLIMGKGFDGKFTYLRVREVRRVPSEGKVYDFTVPGTHSYVTDSFVVHNSAAGSLVAYALGITDLDPIEHGLMFERFLNPERVSMPDIDVDFDDRRRGEVIDYVREKYGDDKVTQLMTRGFLKGRAAIKDAARVLDMPYQLGDKLNKVYPKPIVGRDVALKDIFNPDHERYHEGQEFRDLVAAEPGAQQVVDLAMSIEGIQRGVGMHAAGVVMAGKPLVEITPLMRRDTKSPITTAVEYQAVEELGGIKFDFLGLSNLGTIDEALRLIRLNRGVEVDLDAVSRSLDDPKTFDLVARGDTLGVFQLDSAPMRSLLKLMEPDRFDDISAVLALYRPGPMGAGAHTDYADRKNKRRPATPIHPELADALDPILGETHQLIVYQEQVMKIAQDLAGYSLGKADLLRRAMGKKDKVKLAKEFEGFRDGMRANGYSDDAIVKLWDVLVPFADYAFNRCVSDRTVVRLGDNSPATVREVLNRFRAGEEVWLQSMWPDGTVRPHKVADVIPTGIRRAMRLRTADGRTITATPDHRLMTTRGYLRIDEIVVGQDELIVTERIVTEKVREQAVANIRRAHAKPVTARQRSARAESMRRWNEEGGEVRKAQASRASRRMREYQATLTFADRSTHQRKINLTTDRGLRASRRLAQHRKMLYATNPQFRERLVTHLQQIRRDGYDTGRGFGKTCYASNGMRCDSMNELRMAEFLIEHGIDFEMHKHVGRGQCDFYFAGLYWEMDGMDRHISYFQRKYGDIPFVVVTPEDFRERIAAVLDLEHVRNGDLVVSIEPVSRRTSTIDIQMEEDGPKNYVTWKGIVSHNSHSAAYGLVSYQTAYLKANFPTEYMAALLTTNADNKDKLALYLGECRRMGIEVLVPDVNESELNYTAVGDAIRTGLIGVKGVGEGGINAWLVERRAGGKAKDLVDFLMRADTQLAGKKAVEALNLAGAFDSFGLTRSSISFVIDEACEKARKAKKARAGKGEDLLSLFDGDEDAALAAFELAIPDIPEWDEREKLAREREVLGLYVSGHPLAKFAGAVEVLSSHPIAYLRDAEHPPTDQVKITGLVSAVEKKTTKASGDPWAIVTVEDLDTSIQVFVFPRTYAEVSDLLVRDAVLTFTGRVEKRDDGSTTFAVKSVSQPDLAAAQRKADRAAAAAADGKPAPADAPAAAVVDDGRTDPVRVRVVEELLTVPVVEAFKALLLEFPGSRPVHLEMVREGGAVVTMALGDQFKVAGTGHLAAEIRALLGPDAV